MARGWIGLLWLGLVAVGCERPAEPVDAGGEGGLRPDAHAGDAAPDAGAPARGPWTVVVLPDTQILAAAYPDILEAQVRWILEQREALSILFVLHVGDIVDDNSSTQWDVAHRALSMLDGRVPLVLAPGNHDYGPGGSAADRSTMLNAYFPVAGHRAWPSFGGTFEEGRIDDSYHVFETPSGPWLVVALEFGPRDEVLAWADAVIRAHAMPTIVVTHAYLYADDTRYDWVRRPDQMWNPHSYGLASLPGGVNDGEEMFQAFVHRNDSVELVVCGHVLLDGVGRLTSEQQGGGRVHQLLANFQHQPMGGAGYLRIMTFSEDGTSVHVRTYSPWLDESRTDPEHEFTLTLDP